VSVGRQSESGSVGGGARGVEGAGRAVVWVSGVRVSGASVPPSLLSPCLHCQCRGLYACGRMGVGRTSEGDRGSTKAEGDQLDPKETLVSDRALL
jgi:hypothetical protein